MQRILCSAVLSLLCIFPHNLYAQVYEISGSPYATDGAPLPAQIKPHFEKVIIVNPAEHVWGAYTAKGRLMRWGIATAGATQCPEEDRTCRTQIGAFRIYSLGSASCASNKYNNASMPYCMYFNGGQALHGSSDVQFDNISHGCVRIHIDDAKWLRYQFVEGPNLTNHYQGTKIIIQSY